MMSEYYYFQIEETKQMIDGMFERSKAKISPKTYIRSLVFDKKREDGTERSWLQCLFGLPDPMPPDASNLRKFGQACLWIISIPLAVTLITPAFKLLRAIPESIFKSIELGLNFLATKAEKVYQQSTGYSAIFPGACYYAGKFFSEIFGIGASIIRSTLSCNFIQSYQEWGSADARPARYLRTLGEQLGGEEWGQKFQKVGQSIARFLGVTFSFGGLAGFMALCSPSGAAAIVGGITTLTSGATAGAHVANIVAGGLTSAQTAMGFSGAQGAMGAVIGKRLATVPLSTLHIGVGSALGISRGADALKSNVKSSAEYYKSSTAKIIQKAELPSVAEEKTQVSAKEESRDDLGDSIAPALVKDQSNDSDYQQHQKFNIA